MNQFENVAVSGVEHRRIAVDIAMSCNGLGDELIIHEDYKKFLIDTSGIFDIVIINVDRVIECIGEINTPFVNTIVNRVNHCLILYSRVKSRLDMFKGMVISSGVKVELKCIELS